MRSPVARLKRRLNLLRLTNLSDETQQAISQLESQTDQLLGLLTNLLEWSYIQLKGLRAHPKPVDLSEIIDNILAQTSEPIDQKRISILNQISESTWILADKPQLEAVIRNLVSNSIKFTPTNGCIRLSTKQIDEGVMLIIHDTGIGMSAEQIEKLFSAPEVRTGTSGEPGTGLGLRICREMLGSDPDALRIVSSPGKGTRVSIRLPINSKPALSVN